MAEPVSDHVVSTPEPGPRYDAGDSSDSAAPWHKLTSNSGPADLHTGRVHGDFEDSPPWRQV
jgi:hypothetical protein